MTAADQFADRLTAELSVLDGANIHSMMASEEAVDHLMDLLTAAINESEMLERRLNQYDDLLEHIRDSMEKMEGKTESLETVNENNSALCQELDSLVQKLQVSYEHQQILQEADFSNPADLDIVVEAAWALAAAMLAPIPYSLTRLAAVQEQRKRMDSPFAAQNEYFSSKEYLRMMKVMNTENMDNQTGNFTLFYQLLLLVDL